MKILSNFDRVITEVLADKVRARLTFKVLPLHYRGQGWSLRAHLSLLHRTDMELYTIKGHLDTYRFCDEVWTFLIKDVTFKLDNQSTVSADKVKIVSCNSKRPGEA